MYLNHFARILRMKKTIIQIAALAALASVAIAVGALATVEIIPVKAPLVFGPVLMGLGVILLVTDVALGLKAAGRFPLKKKVAAPVRTPLRSRTDLSGVDKAEVWLAVQTMQRHHGHTDLKGLISSKRMGRSLDEDLCLVCGMPRFERGQRWLQEVMNR